MSICMLTIFAGAIILVQATSVCEDGTQHCGESALSDLTSILQVSASTNTSVNRPQTQASQGSIDLKNLLMLQQQQAQAKTHQQGQAKMSEQAQASTNHRLQKLLAEKARSMTSPVVSAFAIFWAILACLTLAFYARSNFIEHHEEGKADGGKEEENDSPKRRSSSADRTPPSRDEARPQMRRRATITVAEIKKTAKKWKTEDAIGTLTGGAFVVTMVCDLGPNGIVPLPHGLVSTGLVPGILLVFAFYGCCVCTMWMVGRVAFITGKVSFAEQWAYLIGPRTAWVPLVVLVLVCFGNNIEYLCFVADLLSGALPAFGLPLSRTKCVWLFSLFPTLPLCFLKDLSALAPTSMLSLVSVLYLVVAMCIRNVDGSYAPGGNFFKDLPTDSKPNPPHSHMFQIGLPSLVLMNALAMGFLPHYNGCKYYRELYLHTPDRFLKSCAQGMGVVALFYIVAMLVGFQTFGSRTQAVITESYAENDLLINVARVCIGLSILFSFPIMFSGLREAFLQMLKEVAHVDCEQVWKQDLFTVITVVVIAGLTSVLTQTGMVVGLVGAVCGISCIFFMPCTLYAAALSADVATNPPSHLRLTYALMVLGLVLMIGGVYATFCL